MDFQQQIPFRKFQFPQANLQVPPANLQILLSTGFLRQQIPNGVGEYQRASRHATSILQGFKASDGQ